MNRARISRRDFLVLAPRLLLTASGLLGLAGLIRYLDYQVDPPPQTDFDLGSAEGYPVSSRRVLSSPPALLERDPDGGFRAFSLVCTHLGCTVESLPDGFTCPCHGSSFDPQGQVRRGPASRPLAGMRVELTDDGHLHLYTDDPIRGTPVGG